MAFSGSGAASGAGQGAMMGAVGGPIGMGIGAAVGALGGGLAGGAADANAKKLNELQKQANKKNNMLFDQGMYTNDQARLNAFGALNQGYQKLFSMANQYSLQPQLAQQDKALAANMGRVNGDMANRGLYNSTIANNQMRGVQNDDAIARGNIQNNYANMQMGLMNNMLNTAIPMYGQYADRNTNFINNANFRGPSNQAAAYAAQGGSGFQQPNYASIFGMGGGGMGGMSFL